MTLLSVEQGATISATTGRRKEAKLLMTLSFLTTNGVGTRMKSKPLEGK
jgi:hypothetical protein